MMLKSSDSPPPNKVISLPFHPNIFGYADTTAAIIPESEVWQAPGLNHLIDLLLADPDPLGDLADSEVWICVSH